MTRFMVSLLTTGALIVGAILAPSEVYERAENRDANPSDHGVDTSINALLRELQFDDPSEVARAANRRFAAYQRIRRTRKELADGLIDIVTTANDNRGRTGSRALAAKLISEIAGERRAIVALVANADYKEESFVIDKVSPFNGYPCARGLVSIGQSSVPVIFEHLRTYRGYTPAEAFERRRLGLPVADQVSDKAIELYGWTIISVYDGDYEEAYRVVQRATSKSHYKPDMERLLAKVQEITGQPATK